MSLKRTDRDYFDIFCKIVKNQHKPYILDTNITGYPLSANGVHGPNLLIDPDKTLIKLSVSKFGAKEHAQLRNLKFLNEIVIESVPGYSYDYAELEYNNRMYNIIVPLRYMTIYPYGTETGKLLFSNEEEK